MSKNKRREETLSKQAGSYEAPALEVIEIKLEQHILLSASGGDAPDFDGKPWG
jgi:hypothetical protein